MTGATPRFVAVVPVFRQSGLASEAISSALAQGPQMAVVAVDDGCPHAETRAVLEGWQRRAPGRLHRLHQANRGLSAARNAGIALALARFPGLQAVLPLDADNRLDPHAATVFAHLLDSHPEADWFYPNFDMFGLDFHAHSGGPFSVARMSASNQCEAGSLIRTRVLAAGIRFDESLRQGYEDWDFFLQAARAGFRGHPMGQACFRYRKRPESMLSSSHGEDTSLRAAIRARHPWLYQRDAVAAQAAAEVPRYLLVRTGTPQTAEVFTDPRAPEPIDAAAVGDMLAGAWARPARMPAPLAALFARPEVMQALRDARLLRSAVWHLHRALEGADMAALRLEADPDGLRCFRSWRPEDPQAGWTPTPEHLWRDRRLADMDSRSVRAREADALRNADILMLSRATLEQKLFAAAAPQDPGRRSAAAGTPEFRVAEVRLSLEALPPRTGARPVRAMRDFVRRHRAAPERIAHLTAQRPWRQDPQIAGPADLEAILRAATLDGLPLPLPPRERPRIGFVLPIFLFGGVEKCTIALAEALRRRGVDCHLFVYGAQPMAATGWMTRPFAGIHQLTDPVLREWGGPHYMGTALASHPPPGMLEAMMAPLCSMDAVVVTGSAAALYGAARLRRKGVPVLAWEHLLETSSYGKSFGTPYLALAFEGALDRVLTCSDRLARWLHGQGVPRDKILPLPNGPGFPMPRDDVRAAMEARAARPGDAVLRVGFLGRFDLQKGADRLAGVARACAGLPIEFTVTGGAVLDAGIPDMPQSIRRNPPAMELDDLIAAYAGMDVLLMPSRDEGLPLTLFEAQRAGVVPVATDVGAVREAIVDGETGFLVPEGNAVPEMAALLRRLAADPDMLRAMSARAARTEGRWEKNADALLAALRALGAVPGDIPAEVPVSG